MLTRRRSITECEKWGYVGGFIRTSLNLRGFASEPRASGIEYPIYSSLPKPG